MSDPSGKSSAETHDNDTQRPRANGWWTGLGVILCMLLAAMAGFASFSEKSRKIAGPSSLSVDGIVVLTGGPERISAAVRLLEQKTAKRLLISGVYPATTARQLSRLTQAEASLFNCCVDLDKRAPDTRGNAAEAADWATRHKFRKIAVVTSDYHILRAIVEFSRAMPDVELVPYPVASDDARKPARSLSMLRLWISEYVKYLLALLL